MSYLISLCNWTRTDDRILAGVSPRGSLSFYKACQAYAAIHGRDFVTPEDVKTMALPVFKKRIILKTDSILKGYTEENLVKELLDSIPIPNFKAHV